VTSSALARARVDVEAARAWAAARPAVQEVRVTMRDGTLGRAFDARGAVAVRRGEAMRMVLLGPGGATVLDAWVTPTRWRILVPPIGLARRGTCAARGPCDAAPPVAFFRAFFLAPFEGRVVAALPDGRALLRGDDGASLLARGVGSFRLDRLGADEHVEIDTASGRARYRRRSPALEVEVEPLAGADPAAEADPAAFEDPDAPLR